MKIHYTITDVNQTEIWPLSEVKNYLRISHDYDDGLLSSLLATAIESAEFFTGLSLNIHNIKIYIENADSLVSLRYTPVLNINSVLLKSKNSDQDITNEFGFVQSDKSSIFIDSEYVGKDLEIECKVGYLDEFIPRAIKHGILMHVSDMYENSVDAVSMSSQIKDLYTPYRIMKI